MGSSIASGVYFKNHCSSFPRPPSDERHQEYLTTTHGKELAVRWPKLWRQWLVLFRWENVVLVVTPWNATSYGGGGGEDDGDDNDNNNNNFEMYVIVVDKSLMVLLHYSILFLCQSFN
jgi:hypothetical protein